MADYQDDDDFDYDEADDVDDDDENESADDADESEEEQTEEEKLQNNLNIKADFAKTKKQFEAKATFFPFLSEKQKESKNRAKKVEPTKVMAFEAEVRAKQGAFIGKILPSLPTILLVLLCLIGIVLLIAIVAAVADFLFGWIDDLFGGNDASSNWASGITGDYFYGARLVYRDDEQARNDLQVDYIDAFSYVITDFESNEITLVTTYLPPEDYELGGFDEKYPIVNGAVIKIAEIMFVYDNPDAELPTALDELLQGIKYFGFDEDNFADIAAALAEYIANYDNGSLYTASDGADVESELAAQFEESLIEKYTFQDTAGKILPSRTEMLYIKDYVLEDDETSILEDVKNQNFVAIICFPRKNLQLSFITFQVYGAEKDNFDISMFLDGQQIATTNDFEFDKYISKEESEKQFDTNNYTLTQDISLTEQNFNETYADAKSIYSILQQNANSTSLSVAEGDGGKEFLTFAQFGLTTLVNNQNGNAYMCRIYDIDYV